MRHFLVLLPLVTLVYGNVRGYNYGASSKPSIKHNSDGSDVKQIADILHPPSVQYDIHKQIFTFSPPETDRIEDVVPNLSAAISKKRFKIIFIRYPEPHPDLSRAVANLIKSQTEQKTIIYVLNKHTDINDLASKFDELKVQNLNRPEVHFVKYRTAAEAEKAMQTIQKQYESLGGSTRHHAAKLAPIVNLSSARLDG